MDPNPYASPRSEVADFDAVEEPQLATRLQRFGNTVIDSLVLMLLVVALLLSGSAFDPALAEQVATDNLLVLILVTLYYATCEFFFGWTPAKLVTGTRVVTATGGSAGFQQLLLRSVIRLVPFEALSLLGSPPVGWHDRWSRTRVIRTRRKSSLDRTYDLRDSQRRSQGGWQPEPER